MIYLKDVASAHSAFMLQFCRDFERLYGNLSVTPNMHLHTHLADCVFDYGPISGFWLFSFERYNGILGDFCTNNKSVELQLMPKFAKDQAICDLEFPERFGAELQPLLSKFKNNSCSNLLFVNRGVILRLLTLADGAIDLANELWFDVSSFSFGGPHTVEKVDQDELAYLKEVYEIFFPNISSSIIPAFYDKYASVECAGENYGSRFSRLNRSAYIVAKWADQYGGNISHDNAELRPGAVLYYIKQTVTIGEHVGTFCFARVQWFQYHPHRFHCGTSGVVPEVWCANLFDCFGASAFLPIQRISGKFLPGYDKVAGENVLFVVPLNKKYYL